MMRINLRPFCITFLFMLFGTSSTYGSAPSVHESEENHQESEVENGHGDHHEDEDHANDEHGAHEEGEEHGEHHDEHEEEPSGGVGPDKAVTAASKEMGIQLSEKAIDALEIKTAPVKSGKDIELPDSALVLYQAESGIYVFRKGWFKLIPVHVLSKKPQTVRVDSSQIQTGDQVVVSGVPLLRVAELEAWGGSGDGHGH